MLLRSYSSKILFKQWEKYFQIYIIQEYENSIWICYKFSKRREVIQWGRWYHKLENLNLKVEFELNLKRSELKSISENWICVSLHLNWLWWYLWSLLVLFDAVKKEERIYWVYAILKSLELNIMYQCLKSEFKMN